MKRHAVLDSHDVVVVGARCAGAATAMLLARQGFDVALVDRANLPSDTMSTHALARGGIVQLARWGLLDDVLASGAPPIRSASFVLPDGRIDREIKERAGFDFVLAPRRYILDAILLQAAEEAGVTVRTGGSVTGTVDDRSGRVTGVAVRDRTDRTSVLSSRLVIGADGVRSRIARSVGAKMLDERPAVASTTYTYVARPRRRRLRVPHRRAGVRRRVPHPRRRGERVDVPAGRPCPCAPSPTGSTASSRCSRMRRHPSPSASRRPGSRRRSAPPSTCRTTSSKPPARDGRSSATPATTATRSPATASPTPSVTPSSSPTMPAGCCAATSRRRAALAAYQTERNDALAPIFEVTWQMAQFPPVDRFIELQKRLSVLIDDEATWLAERPLLPGPRETACHAA